MDDELIVGARVTIDTGGLTTWDGLEATVLHGKGFDTGRYDYMVRFVNQGGRACFYKHELTPMGGPW